jgi:hypothetical protein
LANAVKIVTSGKLLSRNDTRALGVQDVAAQAVVQSNSAAHQFSRLYFRPRTPTQFHIEGIRTDAECWNGEVTAHAPILVMFVFSARSVLSLPNTHFSTGNMQAGSTTFGATSAEFKKLDFEKIYHEGGIAGDHSIITARCAEVLVPSPLPIRGNLQFILCRSRAERQTFLNSLGGIAPAWADLVRVSDDVQVFQREYRYVEDVSIGTGGITFRIHPHIFHEPVQLRIEAIRVSTQNIAAFFGPAPLRGFPDDGKRWRLAGTAPLRHGDYDVRFWLEGHLAYEARLSIEPSPF